MKLETAVDKLPFVSVNMRRYVDAEALAELLKQYKAEPIEAPAEPAKKADERKA